MNGERTEKINSGKLNLKTYNKCRKFISTHNRCGMNLRPNFESLKKSFTQMHVCPVYLLNMVHEVIKFDKYVCFGRFSAQVTL